MYADRKQDDRSEGGAARSDADTELCPHGDGGVAKFAENLTRTSMGTAAGTTEDLESPEYQEDVNARRFGRA